MSARRHIDRLFEAITPYREELRKIINTVWKDYRKSGDEVYKEWRWSRYNLRLSLDNSQDMQDLTANIATVFLKDKDIDSGVEQVVDDCVAELETMEDEYNERRATLARKHGSHGDDPLWHAKHQIKGLSWDGAKRLMMTVLDIGSWGSWATHAYSKSKTFSDSDAERAYKRSIYLQTKSTGRFTGRQFNFLRKDVKKLSDIKPEDGSDVTEFLKEFYPTGVPATVTVYRGAPRPDIRLRKGDYVTPEHAYAQSYARGKFATVAKFQIDSKNLFATKISSQYPEYLYWPDQEPDAKASPVIEPKTFKEFWEKYR